ncbi:methionine synthase [Geoglobus acetivorans]|uniref:5-methyltetrahydropteroyltriglutamate--homocysteine methyltransferase n=1 Tax=Geoglobus acetivorans TaxID=565033 RepID=A0A0A7GGK7_GEOAI|nr:5-methyltetrahydropteroyltriglutamate--homocysteine methyltransferase [Geoglobus acetivorans]
MIFDEIGSFPLPEGISRDWIGENLHSREYAEMVRRAFLMKVNAGVDLPTYPQFRDMNRMFLDLIKNPEYQEDVYLIKKEFARIGEVEALLEMDVDKLRVCITGPFELYYREFGPVIYDDVLEKISISVGRFVENLDGAVVRCISLDEPSLGTNPELQPTEDQLEIAYENINFDGDVQIHLHSPLYYTKILGIESINVVGIESAKDERAMEFVDREELESADKYVRVGIARSDIDGIVAEYNARTGSNAWKDKNEILKAIDTIESPEVIKERILKAQRLFGERLKYIGPDCGLFSFPSQEHAVKLLENINEARRLL